MPFCLLCVCKDVYYDSDPADSNRSSPADDHGGFFPNVALECGCPPQFSSCYMCVECGYRMCSNSSCCDYDAEDDRLQCMCGVYCMSCAPDVDENEVENMIHFCDVCRCHYHYVE